MRTIDRRTTQRRQAPARRGCDHPRQGQLGEIGNAELAQLPSAGRSVTLRYGTQSRHFQRRLRIIDGRESSDVLHRRGRPVIHPSPRQEQSLVGLAPTQELVSRDGMVGAGLNTRVGPLCRTVKGRRPLAPSHRRLRSKG